MGINKMPTIHFNILYNKYKSTYFYGLFDFFNHSVILIVTFYSIYYFKYIYIKYFMTLLLSLMLTRTFIIFHDCIHDSYTPNKTINYIISTITGILTFTSSNWGLDHKTHHLTNGNINNKYNYKFNETLHYTVDQYANFSKLEKIIYFIKYNPLIYFIWSPLLYFFLIHRFIYIYKKIIYGDKIKKYLIMITLDHIINNIGVYFLCYYLNKYGILNFYLISVYISGVIEFLFFFNQHTFNPAYVVDDSEWSMMNSGLIGSSFILLPWYLKYFFNGIEYHHIHHINSKIPGYNQQLFHEEVVENSSFFDKVTKLTISDCWSNLSLMLYSEKQKKYVTFSEGLDEIKSK